MESSDLSEVYSVNYSIISELEIRKILENNTPYKYEFRKNDDIYGYDIFMYQYKTDNNKWERNLLAAIEVEKALEWKDIDIPPNWYCISLLKRKIFKFDFNANCFIDDEPKFDYPTFYMKFNKNYTNCFCQSMHTLIEKGKNSDRNGKSEYISLYNDSYWEVNKENVVWGIKKSLRYIIKISKKGEYL